MPCMTSVYIFDQLKNKKSLQSHIKQHSLALRVCSVTLPLTTVIHMQAHPCSYSPSRLVPLIHGSIVIYFPLTPHVLTSPPHNTTLFTSTLLKTLDSSNQFLIESTVDEVISSLLLMNLWT